MPIIFLLLLSALSFSADPVWKDYYLVNGCGLFSIHGASVKVFPGGICQFFDDGSFITTNETSLRMITKTNEVKWTYPGKFHHQVNLSHDGKRIFVMTQEHVKVGKEKVLSDVFKILSIDGQLLHEQTAANLNKQVEDVERFSEEEMTHFNSFYEIPAIRDPKSAPEYIKEGNFIANSSKLGIYILSPDLKKVLHHRKIPTAFRHMVHDVQITREGKLLYFNNLVFSKEPELPYSSIQEMDLKTNELSLNFTGEPKSMFFSLVCGGVQILDEDHILFSHHMSGTYIFSRSKNTIVQYVFQTHMQDKRMVPTQQVKAVNLKKFLSHWK